MDYSKKIKPVFLAIIVLSLLTIVSLDSRASTFEVFSSTGFKSQHKMKGHINYEKEEFTWLNEDNEGVSVCATKLSRLSALHSFYGCYAKFKNSFHNESEYLGISSVLKSPIEGGLQAFFDISAGLVNGYEEGQHALITKYDLSPHAHISFGMGYWVTPSIGLKITRGTTPRVSSQIGSIKLTSVELMTRFKGI